MFDIDGTLIRSQGAGKKAMMQAAVEVYGTAGNMDMINFQGRTDPLILIQSLTPHGIDEGKIFDKIHDFKTIYFNFLQKTMPASDAILLPGIRELLTTLKGYDKLIVGLLTGNFYKGAMIKLLHFDIFHHFAMGVFADDTHIRNEMPDVALQRLHAISGNNFNPQDLVIIGDTIYDIECAKTSGAVSVAVATGWTQAETLLEHKPDYFFEELSDTNTFIHSIKEIKDYLQ